MSKYRVLFNDFSQFFVMLFWQLECLIASACLHIRQ